MMDVHFHNPLKNVNSIVSTTLNNFLLYMLVLTHVGGVTDFIIGTFLAFQKESQVKSRNDVIYTGFHMQLRSWKLKLQPKNHVLSR